MAARTPRSAGQAFLGDWQGTWRINPQDSLRARLHVRYADASAASVRYEWDGQTFSNGSSIGPGPWTWMFEPTGGIRLAGTQRGQGTTMTVLMDRVPGLREPVDGESDIPSISTRPESP